MTKEKIRSVLKRLPQYIQMIRENKTEGYFYISKGKRRERLVADDSVRAVVEILDEIISYEDDRWLKEIFIKVREGDKDVFIMINSPLSKGKYYLIKERLVNKIYNCCVYKGLVSYEDILREEIG